MIRRQPHDGSRLRDALHRLDRASAAFNPYLLAFAAGLLVLYMMLYIGITAPRPSPAAAPADYVR